MNRFGSIVSALFKIWLWIDVGINDLLYDVTARLSRELSGFFRLDKTKHLNTERSYKTQGNAIFKALCWLFFSNGGKPK